MKLPRLDKCTFLSNEKRRLYIGAYGFEPRSLGWCNYQKKGLADNILSKALIFNYVNPKGNNKIKELNVILKRLGVEESNVFDYDIYSTDDIEELINNRLKSHQSDFDEIILDITSLTKFLILLLLSALQSYNGSLRIVYSEAEDYIPQKADYEKWKNSMKSIVNFPSKGFGTILRSRSLSSIRMQGQPITLLAFTSFNEQLVRYLIGSISPFRLIFINGHPPREDYQWREVATQYIHRQLISEYLPDNPLQENGLLKRSVSTLYYGETINLISDLYSTYGDYERIMVAATGSKMQTVGLFFAKKMFPDIHIEYPTPDSYYIKGISTGVRAVHELVFDNFLNTCHSI